ncbi:MAG: hypothetical protein ACUVS4_00390, partial [Chloroflexaceae bacterium]
VGLKPAATHAKATGVAWCAGVGRLRRPLACGFSRRAEGAGTTVRHTPRRWRRGHARQGL